MKRILYIVLAIILALGSMVGLMLVHPQPVKAVGSTLTVDTTSDTIDDQPNTGADLATDEDDGSGLSLREAIFWANAGDTVTFVISLSGQTITRSGPEFWIEKDIILDGDLDDDGTPDITINGNGAGRVIYTRWLTAAASLEGLIITNGSGDGAGMYNTESSSPTISNCTFSGNSGAWGGGMLNDMGSSPTITNCTFSGNTATHDGGGMYSASSSLPTITNCTFSGNSASNEGGGMYNGDNAIPTITNCCFFDNTAGTNGGAMSNERSSPIITNCTFSGNTADDSCIFGCSASVITMSNSIIWGNTDIGGSAGINAGTVTVTYSNVQGDHAGTGNISADPLFVDTGGEDFHLQSEGGHWTLSGWVLDTAHSPCIDAGDPASAFNNEPVRNGGRINMGAYGNTAQASKRSPITYYVNDGSTAGDVYCTAVGSDANDGMSAATPKLTIQAIIDTYDLEPGDTVYVDAGTYVENIIIGAADSGLTLNGAGAGLTSVNGSATGTCLYLSSLTQGIISGFTITNGGASAHGGGMFISNSANITVSNCTFSGNTATYGGGMEIGVSTNTTITSCIFSGNIALHSGGGMVITDCSPTITNCTFYGNTPAVGGGGIFIFQMIQPTNPDITNCILWGDTGGEFSLSPGSSPVITYCDVQGGYSGTNIINTDPWFVNAAGGDFHLQSEAGHWTSGDVWVPDAQTSLCIDAGNPGSPCGNEPSPNGGRINMGAYGNTAQASKSAPEINLKEGVTNIADGGIYNFGSHLLNTNTDVTFTIENTGTGDLTLTTPITIEGADAGQFSIQAQPTSTVAASGSTTFAVRFTPTSTGAKTATISIANNDSDENPYNLTIQGTATTPEMNLREGVTDIANGGSYDFGSQLLNTNTDVSFTIENTGTADLTMTMLPITVSGADAGQFSIQAQPMSPVAASGSTTLNVRFTPTSTGAKTATISITNNDSDENPYDLTIQGTARAPAITSFTPTSADTGTLVIINGSDFTGTTAVGFGGTAASSFTVNSDNSIFAVVGSGSSGQIYVTTPGGTYWSADNFIFDNTPPTDPTNVQSTSHTIGTRSGDNTIDVTWTDATDAGTGLDGYSILWDTSAATITDAVKDIEQGVQNTTSPALADGNSHYLHIRSVDNVGNWQSTVHLGPFFIDTTPPKKEKPTPPARPAPLTAGDTFIGNKVGTTGVFRQSVIAPSADGKVQVIIEKGVRGLSEEGKRLSWITVRRVFYTPPPPAGAHIIGLAYRFQPSGATFDPPITITYTYDESEIPAGIAEEDLVIAVWDEANGQWVELPSTVDPVTNTITTQVSHFTVHAIIAYGIPPIQEGATSTQEGDAAIQGGANWGLIGGIIGACIVVIVLFVVLIRRRS